MNGRGQRPVYNRAEGSVAVKLRTHDPTGHIGHIAFAIGHIAVVETVPDQDRNATAGRQDTNSS